MMFNDDIIRTLNEYLRFMYGDMRDDPRNRCKTSTNFADERKTYVVVAEYTYNGIECQILESIGPR